MLLTGAAWEPARPAAEPGFAIRVLWIVRLMTSVRIFGLSDEAGSEPGPPALELTATPASPPSARSVTDTAPFTFMFSI
jgi:hypothetical protein